MLSTWLTQRFLLDLRQCAAPPSRRDSRSPSSSRSKVGDLQARVSGDVSAIEAFLVSGSTRALTSALELVLFTSSPVLDRADPGSLIALTVGAPVLGFGSRYFSRRLRGEVSRERQRRSGSISSFGRADPRAPCRSSRPTKPDRRRGGALRSRGRGEVPRRDGLGPPSVDLLPDASTRIELAGALARHRGRRLGVGSRTTELTVGGLLAFLTFLTRLYSPIRGLGSTLTTAYSAAAGAERVLEVLHEEPLPADRPGRAHPRTPPRRGPRRATSATGTPARPPPRSTTSPSRCAPGEVVAVVGAERRRQDRRSPGCCCAASTPTAGSGAARRPRPARPDAALAATTAWPSCSRRRCSFDGTVRENIAYGRPDATGRADRRGGHARPTPHDVHRRSCPTATRRGSASAAAALSGGQRPAGRHRAGAAVRRPGARPRRADGRRSTPAAADRVLEPLRPADGRTRDPGHLAQPADRRAGRHQSSCWTPDGWSRAVVTRTWLAGRWPVRARCGRSPAGRGADMTIVTTEPPVLAPGAELAPGYVVEELLSRGQALDVYAVFSTAPAVQRDGEDDPPGPGRRRARPRPTAAGGAPARRRSRTRTCRGAFEAIRAPGSGGRRGDPHGPTTSRRSSTGAGADCRPPTWPTSAASSPRRCSTCTRRATSTSTSGPPT